MRWKSLSSHGVYILVGEGELLETSAEAKSLCRDQVLAGSRGDLWAGNVWWGQTWILKQMNMAEMLRRLSKSGRALWFVARSWSLLRVWWEATEHFFFLRRKQHVLFSSRIMFKWISSDSFGDWMFMWQILRQKSKSNLHPLEGGGPSAWFIKHCNQIMSESWHLHWSVCLIIKVTL